MKEQSEADLLGRLASAEPAAYTELAARFGVALHGFAGARLGGDAEAAEDVVLETFANAIGNLRRFDPRRSSLSAWLYGIARRHISTELRRRRRAKSVPAWAQVPLGDHESVAGPDDMAGITDRMEARRRAALIEAALSDHEMEALMLHCVDGFSAREIGSIVNRSERAVESLLHRARQKARERLVGHE